MTKQHQHNNNNRMSRGVERVTVWIGSPSSLMLHTALFIAALIAGLFGFESWGAVLLVLTTIVSLEAIYLSIFIQMTVNRQAESLKEVEEDVGDIQEDIENLGEDIEDIQEDIEEISEEDKKQEEQKQRVESAMAFETLAKDIRRLLVDLEELKKKQQLPPA